MNAAVTNHMLDMDESFWDAVFADEALEPYWHSLQKTREMEAYVLSAEEEALLVPSNQALTNISRVYDALLYSNIRWPVIEGPDGGEVEANYNNYIIAMADPDREYRKRFYEAFMGAIRNYRDTFAQNMNAYITLTEQLDRQHGSDWKYRSTEVRL